MCVVETLAYSAIHTGKNRLLVCTSHLRRQWRWLCHAHLGPDTWLSTLWLGKAQISQWQTTESQICLLLVNVFKIKAFLHSFSLAIREINTTLLASLTMKITGINSTASWCLPGENHSRKGSLLVWHCLCSPCTHLLANEAPKDTQLTMG